MNKRFLIFLITVLSLSTLLAACQAQPTPVYVQGEERDLVAAGAAPFAEHILKGIETNDYSLFTTDFDDAMLKALTETQFATIVKSYGSLGAAQKSEVINIEAKDSFYRVNYKVTYAEKIVLMLIVLPKEEPRKVSGLWFN